MKAKLLKDTPDLKAGAIFESLNYNASTQAFIDNFEDYHWSYVFNFLQDEFTNDRDSVSEDDYIYYTRARLLALAELGWFEILEDELTD